MKTYSNKSNAKRAAKKDATVNINKVVFTQNADGRWTYEDPSLKEFIGKIKQKGLHKNSKAQQVRDIITNNKDASVSELVAKVLAEEILTSKVLATRYVNNNKKNVIS